MSRKRSLWRSWLSDTSNLIHVSAIFFVLVLVVFVIEVGIQGRISYLLFPPLASATFALFYDPDGTYSTVRNLVGGLTFGALVGWLAYAFMGFSGPTAGLALVLTGGATWLTNTEHPAAFSTTLLAVVLRADSVLYVVSVLGATLLVGGVFYVWKTRVYSHRSKYLYESTWSDDNVLVPVREGRLETVDFAAKIASAHEGGRVVILRITRDGEVYEVERLEELAQAVRDEYNVVTEVSLLEADTGDHRAVLDAADRYSCDIVTVPWEAEVEDEPHLSQYIHGLFRGDVDVAVYRGTDGETDWSDVLVPVKGGGKLSRLMVELGLRLANGGVVSISTVIDDESERNRAARYISNLIDGFDGRFETRIANLTGASREEFIARESNEYDVVVLGASTDRTVASWFLSPPMVEKIIDRIEVPVVLVHSDEASRLTPRGFLGTTGIEAVKRVVRRL